jgi:hypothetical protein
VSTALLHSNGCCLVVFSRCLPSNGSVRHNTMHETFLVRFICRQSCRSSLSSQNYWILFSAQDANQEHRTWNLVDDTGSFVRLPSEGSSYAQKCFRQTVLQFYWNVYFLGYFYFFPETLSCLAHIRAQISGIQNKCEVMSLLITYHLHEGWGSYDDDYWDYCQSRI